MDALQIIDRHTVEKHLTMTLCIDAMRAAMIAVSSGKVVAPPRLISALHDKSGYFGTMPGSIRSLPVFGAKLVSLLPGNPAVGRPAIQGFVCLFDHETGAPVALIDGASVTAIRTAAASGLATQLLARDDVATHGILGSGVQALAHADAIRTARPSIRKTMIWGRDFGRAQSAAAEIEAKLGIEAEVVAAAENAAQCDVISTVTGATEPVLRGAWLNPGAHINLVGAHSKTTREADTRTVTRSKLYVDSMESTHNEGGDLLIPISEGAITIDDIMGEIGDVAAGKIVGRENDAEITCYNSLGVIAQDLFAAAALLEVLERAW